MAAPAGRNGARILFKFRQGDSRGVPVRAISEDPTLKKPLSISVFVLPRLPILLYQVYFKRDFLLLQKLSFRDSLLIQFSGFQSNPGLYTDRN